jgi:hypothetical protein
MRSTIRASTVVAVPEVILVSVIVVPLPVVLSVLCTGTVVRVQVLVIASTSSTRTSTCRGCEPATWYQSQCSFPVPIGGLSYRPLERKTLTLMITGTFRVLALQSVSSAAQMQSCRTGRSLFELDA